MMNYHPKKQQYKGDGNLRAVTSMTKVARAQSSKRKGEPGPSLTQVKKAKKWGNSRLCGNLDKLCNHVNCIQKLKKAPLKCAWCGLDTYQVCGKCHDSKGKQIPLHYNPKGPKTKGLMCFYHYHNDMRFGLGKNDVSQILGKKRSDWTPADKHDIQQNAKHIENVLEGVDDI